MENDETMEQDITPEETQNDDEPISEDAQDSTPTLEDYQRLEKENKTLKAQKEHWRKKATTEKVEVKKPNEAVTPSREEIIALTNKVPVAVIDEAKIIAEAKGISLTEALDYPTIKAFKSNLEAEERHKKAQLGASSGSSGTDGDLMNAVGMSREEHRKAIGM